MSAASERDRLDPNHPLYYAPRRSSERPELRPIPSQEATAERAGRPGSSAISVDAELENAVSDALRNPFDSAIVRRPLVPFDTRPEKAVPNIARHPLDPEIIHEHPALALRRMEMLGAVRRFALPVGIAAIAAVFTVFMISAWRSDSVVSPASGVTQPMRTDPPQVIPPQVIKTEATPKSALADFQGILAPSSTGEPSTREQSEKLLQGFVQWRQNSDSTQAVEK
jgi:hypothetical protein